VYLKKVWDVDPLECLKCSSKKKIISFIDDRLLVGTFLEVTTAETKTGVLLV